MMNIDAFYKNIRSIWVSIQLALPGKESKAILLTSANPGEGVSTAAINLAKIIANEKKTLLIEANIEQPIFSKIFNLQNENGLGEILAEKLDIRKSYKKSNEIENLAIITTGLSSAVSHPLTLKGWEGLINFLKNEFEVILIDAPAIIPNQDTAILATLCDGVILVIQADKTRREVVERTNKIILDAKAKLLGCIFNKRVYKIPKFVYKRL